MTAAGEPPLTPLEDGALAPRSPPGVWYAHSRAVFTGGNELALLRGGDALFPPMCKAIAAARRDVWVATYIFAVDGDPAGRAGATARADAARRGVRVRVVVDGFGSLHALPLLRELLEPAGVALAVFRPLHGWWSWLQPGQLRRLHQKLCVVDGELAFVGGINLIDDRHDLRHGWFDRPRLDYAVRLRGPVVGPIEQTARAMWTRAAFGRDWRDEVRQIARSSRPVQRARRLLRRLRMSQRKPRNGGPQPLPRVRAAFLVRDNLRQRRSIERSYIDALRSARRRIDLVCPYFYPGSDFRHALVAAARRGVQVRLLLQGKADYRVAALAAQVLYDEMLACGVRIFEYLPAFLHAKVAVVDDHWATVGSSNIDPLSLLVNLEANVVVDDPLFVETLAAELDRDFADSREVTAPPALAGWRRWLRRGLVAWAALVYLRVAGAAGRY